MAESSPPIMAEPGQPVLCSFRATDGYEWQYRHFPAQGRCRGRVVAIHGIQSHGGWYLRSSAALAAAGFDLFFLDRRGSGLNAASRGDFSGFRRVLDDFAEFIKTLPRDGLPTHLLCISWGGKLGLGLQYRYPKLVDSLVLLCPGIVSKVNPPLLQRLWIGRCRVRCPSRMFPIPLNDPRLFTTSMQWQKFVAEDPLALRTATARLLFSSFSLDMYLKRARRYVDLPVLLLLAENDQIIDNRGVRRYVERLPALDKEVIEYPGASHTLEFESEDHPWLTDLLNWLEKHSP